MLSQTAKIIVPRLLTLMSAGKVNLNRQCEVNAASGWAIPLKVAGVPNLYCLNENLYRSGQPTPAGFSHLQELGIRSCLSLRTHCTDDRDALRTSVLCKSHPMFGLAVNDDDITSALLDIHYKLPKPVLIHCYQGSDRTGLICAAYRVLIENWSKEKAIDEMTLGGFGYHQIFHPLVAYLEQMDVDRFRRKLQVLIQHHA